MDGRLVEVNLPMRLVAPRVAADFMDEAKMKVKGLELSSQLNQAENTRVTPESPQQAGAVQQEAVKYDPQRTPKEQAKIDDLKAKVASGEYKVDSTKVAKAIVDFYKSA